MENTICTCTIETVWGDSICRQTILHQKSEKSVWDGFRQLVDTVSEFTLEVLRSNNAPEPIFPNGGARVLIRLDWFALIYREIFSEQKERSL